MPININWLSLALGILIGLVISKGCSHPKSPLSGTSFFADGAMF